MRGACSTYEEVRKEFWWWNPERNIRLGKTRRRWEYNIKMNPKKMGQEGVDCTGVAQGRGKKKVGCCQSGDETSESIKKWRIS